MLCIDQHNGIKYNCECDSDSDSDSPCHATNYKFESFKYHPFYLEFEVKSKQTILIQHEWM